MTGILGKDKLGSFRLGVSNSLKLITDRTQADVDSAEYLNSLWVDGVFTGTEEELAAWHGNPKGAYNAADLNRVESAAEFLAKTLKNLPVELQGYAAAHGVAWDAFFDVPYDPGDYTITVKTDWTAANIQTPEDMERYLANVAKLRTALDYATAELPTQMEDIRWPEANAIEKVLVDLDAAIKALRKEIKAYIDATAAAWYYSGELYAGEV